ncbi:MAG: aminomethyl-transferring glycine dehydrogenase [Chitinophagales bacterium]|nr:aminomethyl-transferring glycine dehydrogenase [Chitinophagales bacterium]
MNYRLSPTDSFADRHIGPDEQELQQMLDAIGVDSLDQLVEQTVPKSIRLKKELDLPAGISEYEYLRSLKEKAAKNKVFRSYLGLGYYNNITPSVIKRNIFENPGWYTQYTPYQAEIAQGRLEALLNFQTMVSDLTGLPVANASLLDEGTAAAEAMHMLFSARNKSAIEANIFFVSDRCLPQTIDVLKTRSAPVGIELVIGDHQTFQFSNQVFGCLLQYPAADGALFDYRQFIEQAHQVEAAVVMATDLLSLALLTSPGELGADVAIGNSQRFGVPMGFGGPHAAFFATKEDFKRLLPGRIIGVSIDANDNRALRMALQTREQHIRREKATSNICTAQALLAIMAGMYGVYHGPKGIKNIASRTHQLAVILNQTLGNMGYKQVNDHFFDTLKIDLTGQDELLERLKAFAVEKQINFRYFNQHFVGITLDGSTLLIDVQDIIQVFILAKGDHHPENYILGESKEHAAEIDSFILPALNRTSGYLQHPVFNSYHSESKMMRYIKSLENKDLSLTHSMIALGSCTMKLNAATQLMPVSWPEFGGIHPFVPLNQVTGYLEIIKELEDHLSEITGFAATSLQPNSGAQGEYAGLMVIRAYHQHQGQSHRNIALIPSSAHGTNPASAVMAGMEVVVVKCDEDGSINMDDLRSKAAQYKDQLACFMITYPSTYGVFDETVVEICKLIHDHGGQVYMDGANMNAQVGLTNPATIGADVCHLNLHKTFAIPHGGGGPGMGPICVAAHLAPYLPGHTIVPTGGEHAIPAVSAAPYGSASILLISYAYIKMLGKEGVTKATKYAILGANYIKARLENNYKVLYQGKRGRVAHELIIDFREFKAGGVDVEDAAKRLIDYGFHAPTMSFPVPGTMMIEPTESEDKAELDRLCDALLSIRQEIEEVLSANVDAQDNVLKHAPHTTAVITADKWTHAYSREKAAYPLPYLRHRKFWPSVGRVNNPYGDRNLICTCPPLEAYEKEQVAVA